MQVNALADIINLNQCIIIPDLFNQNSQLLLIKSTIASTTFQLVISNENNIKNN